MSFKLKISIAVFIVATGFMAGFFYALPVVRARVQPSYMLPVFIAAGMVLSLMLTIAVYAFTRKIPGRGAVRTVEKGPETAVPPPPAERPFDAKAVQVLSLLQKKGRLIDFLQEDISGYEDSQIGAAVRNIHKGCREALQEHVTIEPVMKESEGSEVTVVEGFDPSAVRLTGNVTGSPPFKGILRHSGWRVAVMSLPPLPENHDPGIIEPAEVEVV